MSEYLDDVQRYCPDANRDAVVGIVKHLGIALKSQNASLVACSSKIELLRVRESWCKRKLGLTASDDELDKAIKEICGIMKDDARKQRVTFYYLLAEKYKKLGDIA